jgi:hypothetical protein
VLRQTESHGFGNFGAHVFLIADRLRSLHSWLVGCPYVNTCNFISIPFEQPG